MGGYKKIKKIFITYPRTALNKKDFGSFLIESTNPKEVTVSQETHSEPGEIPTHLHAYLDLDIPMAKEVIIKKLRAHYGEYETNRIKVEGVKSSGATKNYLIKEDEDPFMWSRVVGQRTLTVRDVYRQSQRAMGLDYDLSLFMTEEELNMNYADYCHYKEQQEKKEQEYNQNVERIQRIRKEIYDEWKHYCVYLGPNGYEYSMTLREYCFEKHYDYPAIPTRGW